MQSTENYLAQIERLRQTIDAAEVVLIGAGAGLSTSAGLSYTGKRFKENFADFAAAYHFQDMYAATFYPYDSLEAYWGYMSRHININRYAASVGKPYVELLPLMKNKDYFVLTTNVDHQFQRAGLDKCRLFYIQGDYGLWQCSVPCHQRTYDNRDAVLEMLAQQHDLCIPSEQVPCCPKCGQPMSMNLRCDNTFVQDEGWYVAASRYKDFIHRHAHDKILYLELGVGCSTPGIIKHPFWQMTAQNPNATYACINLTEAYAPDQIRRQSICIHTDAGAVIDALAGCERSDGELAQMPTTPKPTDD